MRNFLLYCASILLYCLLISTTGFSQLQKIYLHPKAPGTEKQSRFIDSIRFIPLEIKEEVDLAAYSNITVTEKYFLITDYQDKKLLVYLKTGKFIKEIKYKKLGDDFDPDYQEHSNQVVFFGGNKAYALTPKDEIKIRLDWSNPRNKKYYKKYIINLDDTAFTIKKVAADEKDIIGARHYNDSSYWQGQINTSPLYKDSLDYELKLYKKGKPVKNFFPYNPINEPRYLHSEGGISFTKTDTLNHYIVTRPYNDTVYKMTGDSLFPAYQIILPLENSLPATFFTKPFKNKTERENFNRNNGLMLRQIYNVYETPQFIFIGIGYLSNYESYIYHKQNKVTYKTKNIKTDSTQYGLKLIERIEISGNEKKFYKLQKAKDLITFFKEHTSITVPKELESFLKSDPTDEAPVIVAFTIKN